MLRQWPNATAARGRGGRPLSRAVARSIDAEVSTELQTLAAAALKLATSGAACFVDLAGVRFRFGPEVEAASVRMGGKGIEPEVSRLDPLGKIGAPDAAPAHQVLRRNQDAPVVARPAASPAAQTVEPLAFREFFRCVERSALQSLGSGGGHYRGG